MTGPRIVLLDIETIPNIVTSWGLKVDGYLGHENILEERYIVCAAWKYLGVPVTHSISVLSRRGKDGMPDYGIVRKLHDVLSHADAVIAHNGDNFDIRWVLTRIAIAGMQPPPPFKQIDTKKIAKRRFNFNSNRLDYLGRVLKLGNKIKTDYGLWLDCLKGDRAAIRKMVHYNKADVRLLEKVYERLRPFVQSSMAAPNAQLWDRDAPLTCPTCGESDALQARGFRRNLASVWQRYQCQKCGAWSARPSGTTVAR